MKEFPSLDCEEIECILEDGDEKITHPMFFPATIYANCLDKQKVRDVLDEELGISLNAYKKRVFVRLGL